MNIGKPLTEKAKRYAPWTKTTNKGSRQVESGGSMIFNGDGSIGPGGKKLDSIYHPHEFEKNY